MDTNEPKRKSARSKGGVARAASMTPEERKALAKKGALARWNRRAEALKPPNPGDLPVAKYKGVLALGEFELPAYVLDTGQRVIGRTSFTEVLTSFKKQGDLEGYLDVAALNPFIDMKLVNEQMVVFQLPEVAQLERTVKGLSADLVIEICRGYVSALHACIANPEEHKLSPRQYQMAMKASAILAACAKVGLDALIDEATGAQYDRAEDALRVKLRAYLEDEMRKWEKTFPDELWVEFARLTNWKGTVTQRPKYWGRLVMELVYEYLDKDVAKWLKENAPAPKHGQNYHQWLSGQFGLRKLVEHIWVLIGIARTCNTMYELRERMAALNGKSMVQMYLPLPHAPRTAGA